VSDDRSHVNPILEEPMARILTTLSVLCLYSPIAFSSDLVGFTPENERWPVQAADGFDVEIANQSAATSLKQRELLLGDMGGFRTVLARHGMTLEISNLDEGFGSPQSRRETGSGGSYHGLTDVWFSIDTESAGWWKGGRFLVDLQNVRGGDISDLVGDLQGISNIVAPPGTRFVEYFLDQSFADGRFRFKLGKQDANADFVVSEGGGEFINSSFGLIPTVPLPTFPAPALGVMAGWAPSESILLKIGYWDGAPAVCSCVSSSIVDGSGGTVAAAGIEITPFGGDIIDGTYRVGVWRHSDIEIGAPAAKTSGEPPTSPAKGLYFTVDQGIWESGARRLSVFAQGGWGEADRSAVSRYFGGGLTFTSPFATRPDDIAGIGVAHAKVGGLERGEGRAGSETVVELFYKIPVLGWMTLNPDIQWIHRPGGIETTAFAAGIRVATVF
jgi:porin